MDLNAINERELMLVPGIGEKTAHAIMDARRASGRFSAVDQLMEVPGIGTKKFEKFKDYFFVGNKS
jgi:competence protein ComEA